MHQKKEEIHKFKQLQRQSNGLTGKNMLFYNANKNLGTQCKGLHIRIYKFRSLQISGVLLSSQCYKNHCIVNTTLVLKLLKNKRNL